MEFCNTSSNIVHTFPCLNLYNYCFQESKLNKANGDIGLESSNAKLQILEGLFKMYLTQLLFIIKHTEMFVMCEYFKANLSDCLSTELSQQFANISLFLYMHLATDISFSVNEADLHTYNKGKQKLPGLDFASQPERFC